MKIHHVSVEEAVQSLRSGATGLSSTEAERRLREFGPNRVHPVRGTSLSVRFLKGFTHFCALILWVAAALASLAEWNNPGTGMATLGFAILNVILENGLFSFWQEYRAERAMAALKKFLPTQVKVLRAGNLHQEPAEMLVLGDVILLDDGDDVPADCHLLEAFSVWVNNATVTGESAPSISGPASLHQGGAAAQPQHPPGRDLPRFRTGQGPRVRHRHAHGVREDRPPDAGQPCRLFPFATGNQAPEPAGGIARARVGVCFFPY